MRQKTVNILAIRNSYVIGGAELYYIKLAEAFQKYRIPCKITLLTNNVLLAEEAKKAKIRTHVVDVFNKEIGTKRDLLRLLIHLPAYIWTYLRLINKLTKSKRYVFVFSGRTEKIVLTPFLKLAGCKILWLEHGHAFTKTMSNIVLFFYKLLSTFASKILVEDNSTLINLLNNGIKSSKIELIKSGIDTSYFKPPKRKNKDFVVGFMASITHEKGIFDFLKVCRAVYRKNKLIKYIVIGDGPQLAEAKQFATENNLNQNITFVGWQKDPRKYLAKMTVFISPIHHLGGLSLSVQSAMATGATPFVTDIGGNPDLVINGITGFIYKNFEPKKVANDILELHKNIPKQKLISYSARKFIENNYSSKLLAKKWINILE